MKERTSADRKNFRGRVCPSWISVPSRPSLDFKLEWRIAWSMDPFCFRNTRCVSVVGHRQTSVKLVRDNRAWCVPYFGGTASSRISRVYKCTSFARNSGFDRAL